MGDNVFWLYQCRVTIFWKCWLKDVDKLYSWKSIKIYMGFCFLETERPQPMNKAQPTFCKFGVIQCFTRHLLVWSRASRNNLIQIIKKNYRRFVPSCFIKCCLNICSHRFRLFTYSNNSVSATRSQ